jgi:phosphoadenosine phosphosulfate reductase
VVLAHLISRIDRSVPVIFLDTRFHFRETYEFKRRFAQRYGLNLVELKPLTDPGPLYKTDPDRCCFIRKVEPLERAIVAFDAWISAVRQDQSETRRATELVEYHEVNDHPIVKVFPLARWSRADVWRYIRENGVPYHPLLDQGYTSIGCWPCTRPTAPGEAERAGRWSGSGKTECGLHTFTAKREG